MGEYNLILTSIIIFITITIPPIEGVFSLTIYYNTIYVDDDNTSGPWDGSIEHPYQHIQDAINHAENGDIIEIYPGIYNEYLLISKPISIVGVSRDNTILTGEYNSTIIDIIVDNVSVINLTIENSGGKIRDAGINIYSNNIYISNCFIHHTRKGISGVGSNISFSHCIFHRNTEGIHLYGSNRISINNCLFTKNAIAANLEKTNDISIYNSTFSLNGISIQGCHTRNMKIKQCIIQDNSVNKGGIFLLSNIDALISYSKMIHNGVGISISSSSNVSIRYCTFINNTHYGISLRSPSDGIIITHSIISNNLRCGIYIEENNECRLYYNDIVGNRLYGICIQNAICYSQNNWWGSPLGPIFSLKKHINTIKNYMGIVDIFPWSIKPIYGIGAPDITGSSLETPEVIEKEYISFNETDSDNDGVPDWWEEKWGYNPYVWDDHRHLDPDNDELNNIEECYTDIYGSNPYHKDIFLEIDWMKSISNSSNKPSLKYLNYIIKEFEEHNITLHIDIGNLGGGEEIPDISMCLNSYSTICYVYWKYFLHDNPLNPRKGIFHYGVICNYCPDVNYPFIGWDNLDSFAISAGWIQSIYPYIPKEKLIAGAIIHQLGHTLGLIADTYEGIDNLGTLNIFSYPWLEYINYISCMNYFYKFKVLSFSDGTHGRGDFNDWENMDLKFFKNSDFKR
ncbi:MAG: hypothetical protein DRN12_06025 [Thermoplasmata archaeon]|nr:MAG: hypothetical protein DRN12_06025 [Thermoplasmata archaeon]